MKTGGTHPRALVDVVNETVRGVAVRVEIPAAEKVISGLEI